MKLGPCDTQLASSDHNQSALLVFVHIPKAAGTSALSDLRHRGYRTSYFSQAEPCLRDVYCRAKGATHVTLLRSPRDHILSQYHMCRDSEWGRLHASSALPATFEAWLDHFLAPNSTSQLDAFNCYNPWNMQARALTCSVASGSEACRNSLEQTFVQRCEQWGSELHRPSRVDSLEPPVPSALSSLDSMVQLAGVVELYSESWCLLELRMRRELHQRTRKLPPECNCARLRSREKSDSAPPRTAKEGIRSGKLNRTAQPLSFVTHDVRHHDWQSELQPRVLRKMDALSKTDSLVYVHALRNLLAQLRTVEREHNTTILCSERLQLLRERTAYLPGLWGHGAKA